MAWICDVSITTVGLVLLRQGILSRPHGTGIQFLQSRDEALAADPALAAENLVNPLGAMLDHEEPGFGDQVWALRAFYKTVTKRAVPVFFGLFATLHCVLCVRPSFYLYLLH